MKNNLKDHNIQMFGCNDTDETTDDMREAVKEIYRLTSNFIRFAAEHGYNYEGMPKDVEQLISKIDVLAGPFAH